MLTGNKDVDYEILNSLNDKDLASYCSTKKEARKVCQDEQFWINRIIKYYGKETLLGKGKANLSYRDYYTSGKAETYTMCKEIEKIPHLSEMVIDDFYNPHVGFIPGYYTRDTTGLTYLLLKIVLTRADNKQNKQEIREMINRTYQAMDDFRRDSFTPYTDEMTGYEKMLFYNTIDVFIGMPGIIKSVSRSRPNIFEKLEKPENSFRLITHIHQGFIAKKIPLNVLWSELCNVPYVLEYKFPVNIDPSKSRD